MTVDAKFQTPENICEYMVGLIPKHVRTVLEPTKGLGNLLKCLKDYDVTAPDDFFTLEKERYDCVVMNPPFSSASAFLENAPKDVDLKGMRVGYFILNEVMERSDSVIALMPWFTISDSDVRLRKLKEFGLVSISVLPRKTFNYARIQTCVIELSKGYKGSTEFKIL